VRVLLVVALMGFLLVGWPASTAPKNTAQEPAPFGMARGGRSVRQSGDWRSRGDISRSGRDFLEVCSSVAPEKGAGGETNGEGNRDAARDFSDEHAWRDATCLAWVGGFTEGFLVHDELLGVPRRDRLACVPNGESAMRIVAVMKKYLADHPERARRATRFIASLALAGAFPCRAGK
jgi:Ssp1 endopeptidase immunity protein Rap1a